MNEIQIIANTIIEMDKPFKIIDLYIRLKREHGIDDRALILDVLQSLLNDGVVSYSEIDDNVWAFMSTLNCTA